MQVESGDTLSFSCASAAVERTWHTRNSQGRIMASTFRSNFFFKKCFLYARKRYDKNDVFREARRDDDFPTSS